MEIIELEHPLSQHYLTILRDKNTTFETFRLAASKLSYLLIIEATKELEKATSAIEKAETSKARLDASVELKKATARLEGINYLS